MDYQRFLRLTLNLAVFYIRNDAIEPPASIVASMQEVLLPSNPAFKTVISFAFKLLNTCIMGSEIHTIKIKRSAKNFAIPYELTKFTLDMLNFRTGNIS